MDFLDGILESILGDDDTLPTEEELETEVGLDDPVEEAAILLEALRQECTDEEFNALVTENAATLALYELIPSDSVVTEATTKIIKTKVTKESMLTRLTKFTSLQLARANGDPNYDKYIKYRDLMKESRQKIYDKWGNKAVKEARRIMKSGLNKAGSIKSNVGGAIKSKIENSLKKINKK